MFRIKKLLTFTLLIMILCGCQGHNAVPTSESSKTLKKYITINGTTVSVEEINEGIKNTFNSVLYYHGNDETSNYLLSNKDLLLNKEIQYELYFQPNVGDQTNSLTFPQTIYFVITNIQYPSSSAEKSQLYEFGVDITEWGLRSDFSYQGHVTQGEMYHFIDDTAMYLGNHTLLIDGIKKPAFEKMDDEWKGKATRAIRLYMDENDFYVTEEDNLAPGKYHVYVQSFFKSDKDSVIIFENENGGLYVGDYYFVHDISGNSPADLNHVKLMGNGNEKAFESYLEKVRSDPALVMEYTVPLTRNNE